MRINSNSSYLFESYSTGRDWLFGYPTATIDRFTAGVEEIYMPVATSLEGELDVSLQTSRDTLTCSKVKSLRKRMFTWKRQPARILEHNQVGIDLRLRSPQNWAHAITNHLPLALLVKKMAAAPEKEFVTILPGDIPPRIEEIFELSGFSCLSTDAPVKGSVCEFSLNPWISIRGKRCQIIQSELYGSELLEKIKACRTGEDRIFLARKKLRTIENLDEIVALLENKGFRTIYPEDHGMIEQLAFIYHAREIIGIHGAALGPLIIKSAAQEVRPYKLLEIFSPAHMTNVWRMIAWQQGAKWAGVRGKLWPKLVQDNADFIGDMKNFKVSPESIEKALSYLEIEP